MSSGQIQGPQPPRPLIRQSDVVNKELHPQAERLIEELTVQFATSLILQAKTLAHRRDDDVVVRNHVEEALEMLQQERRQKQWQDWAVAFGGALFGTFAQGFLTELSAGRNPIFLGIYVLLGFLGMLLIFAGFRR